MSKKVNPIFMTDGYKLGHRNQYPTGTEGVYAAFIPRDNRYFKASDKVVFFGLQHFIKKYLIEEFNENFFNVPVETVITEWNRRINTFLGSDNIVGSDHIRALHELGYLPLEVRALKEGTVAPVGVPQFTIHNTIDEFFWLPNFLETLMSAEMWMPSTSATSSYIYKRELARHAKKVGWTTNLADLGFNIHDFSMRGMPGVEASVISGLAHLAVFNGSETIPAIEAAEQYYNIDAEKELLAATIPATEHSVMSAGSQENEYDTFKRLLTEVYPDGFVSIVSDTYDYERVLTDFIPALKNEIMARNGRFVVRPDSGDPVDIICGASEGTEFYCKGTYEHLWDVFGGTINEKGYKVLDPHIGIIYGDSITLARQKEIYRRLEEKGFATTNLVLGVGSYTFQGVTRDSFGFALKTSAVKINGEWKDVFKDPKTQGQGMNKKSYKGFIRVEMDRGGFVVIDKLRTFTTVGDSTVQLIPGVPDTGLLKPVFKDGKLLVDDSLTEIRKRIDAAILEEI